MNKFKVVPLTLVKNSIVDPNKEPKTAQNFNKKIENDPKLKKRLERNMNKFNACKKQHR